jgi:hypothetical protein
VAESLIPNVHFVGASKTKSRWQSIGDALLHADPGDTVVVSDGVYSPSETAEKFPLYVPPGVNLLGAGLETCLIDGEGRQDLSFQPPREGQSLVLLGDGASISGFTIKNSGGNGVANESGARAMIARNEIRDCAQHGIFISSPNEVVIRNNVMRNNGTAKFEPKTAHALFARQGHHIFVIGKGSTSNNITISDNRMEGAFADAVTLAIIFDQRVQLRARILSNEISGCMRHGIAVGASYGPSHNRIWVDARYNRIHDNEGAALHAQAASPASSRLVENNGLRLDFIENECRSNGDGIRLLAGVRSVERSRLDAILIGNTIATTAEHAVTCVAAFGQKGYAPKNNELHVVISRNELQSSGAEAVSLIGARCQGEEKPEGNAVRANFDLETTGAPKCEIGIPGNSVLTQELLADS